MNANILTESQKISLITYKMRINGSPEARYAGKDQHGNYIFENIKNNICELSPSEYNEIDEVLNCLKEEHKNSAFRSVA